MCGGGSKQRAKWQSRTRKTTQKSRPIDFDSDVRGAQPEFRFPGLHEAPSISVRDWFRGVLLSLLIAALTGSACAFFLWSLDAVTLIRWAHPWLLGFLPVIGIFIVLGYERYGRSVGRGTHLVLDALHESTTPVPRRLTPFVLASTLLTHLGGGSAGREGTAVQMGAGLASTVIHGFQVVSARLKNGLLLAGIAAGFGAVFGTPWAGALFALEFVRRDRLWSWLRTKPSWCPALFWAVPITILASWSGHWVCLAWGAQHTAYGISSGPWTEASLVTALIVGLAAGLAARTYVLAAEGTAKLAEHFIRESWQRPVVGAAVVLGVSWMLGTDAYLGLGVRHPLPTHPSIVTAFHQGGATTWSWFWKLALTAVTLGSGFKGGEVTPLFFIGATLGNALATRVGLPVDLAAATGFVAVFAGASRTPLTCAVMGAELFGIQYGPNFLVACLLALVTTSHRGIYSAQRGSDLRPINAK